MHAKVLCLFMLKFQCINTLIDAKCATFKNTKRLEKVICLPRSMHS